MNGGCYRGRVPHEVTLLLSATGGQPLTLDATDRKTAHEDHDALKRALDDVRRSEDRLRTIVDTIPALVWCFRPDGTINYFNQRWHDYTGISREEAYGVGDVESTAKVFRTILHPDDGPRVLAKWQQEILSAGKPGEFDVRMRRHDGEYRWFMVRLEPLLDDSGRVTQWYGINSDIEDLKRAEAKLRRDEEELRRIVDAIPQTIVVLSPEGRAVYANRTTLEYTGLTIDEVVASDFRTRVFHPEDVSRLENERRNALALGEPFENEQRARRRDGQYRWFLVRYNPLRDEQGKVLHWYATGMDIEDRKRDELRVRSENLALREDIDSSSMFEEIVGSSAALRRVLADVARVAPVDSTVLISGETGTGKELIARAIHKRSARASRAFIRVNCAAIPPALIPSELFGHEKGAFTGATQRRLGRFEAADGGTILLDEVGELPPETQIALLRVLQEGEIERIGSSTPVRVDVRVLAATNRDLKAAVALGRFREDLYYRLNVFPVRLPPLRERLEDLPLLVEYLVQRYAAKIGKRLRQVSKSTSPCCSPSSGLGISRGWRTVLSAAAVFREARRSLVINRGSPAKANARIRRPGPLTGRMPDRDGE